MNVPERNPFVRLSVKCNPVSSFPFPSHMFSALRSCAQTTRTAFASVLYSSAPWNMNTRLVSCFPAKRLRRRTYSDCFMPVPPRCRGRLPGDIQCNSVFPCVGSRLERVHHPTAWELYRVTKISQSWCDWTQFYQKQLHLSLMCKTVAILTWDKWMDKLQSSGESLLDLGVGRTDW